MQDRYNQALMRYMDTNLKVAEELDRRTAGGYSQAETDEDIVRIGAVEVAIAEEFHQDEIARAYEQACRDLLHWGLLMVAWLPGYEGQNGQDLLALFNRAEKNVTIMRRVIGVIMRFKPKPELEFFALLCDCYNLKPQKHLKHGFSVTFDADYMGDHSWVIATYTPHSNYLTLKIADNPHMDPIRLGVDGQTAIDFGKYLLEKK